MIMCHNIIASYFSQTVISPGLTVGLVVSGADVRADRLAAALTDDRCVAEVDGVVERLRNGH